MEQVFLLQRESGALLAECGVETGMLPGVRAFTRESTQSDVFHAGGFEIWIEPGPETILAAVIRGVPPRALGRRLKEALEDPGDLESCLVGEAPHQSPRPSPLS